MKPTWRWMGAKYLALAVCGFAIALSLPPLRSLIEQSMVWHMVVQMPLLVLGGWLVMGIAAENGRRSRFGPWNRFGLTGFMAAQAIAAYWMLPVTIDRAVVMPTADLLKIATLLGCGAMLRHSITRAPLVLQLFFVGVAVSMSVWLGVYFGTVDLRLCNAYSLDSQHRSGFAIAVLGSAVGALWLAINGRELLAGTRPSFDT